jgi:hypothetical protein
MAATTTYPEYEHALPGYGAFKHADAKDAKRRRPEGSLEAYAQARGLEFLDTQTAGGFNGVMPADSRLQFNVMRGHLPGGRDGVLFHNVLAVEHDGSEGGPPGLVVSVYNPKAGLRSALGFVPYLGGLLDSTLPPKDKRPDAVGVPTTVAAALVPEASAVPDFSVDDRQRLKIPGLGGDDDIALDELGVPGMTLRPTSVPAPDRAFAERLMTTPFADVLRRYGDRADARVTLDHGRLWVRLDGYLHESADLDTLAESLAAAATGLAQAAAPLHSPQPFAQALPAAKWPETTADLLTREGQDFETIWQGRHRPPAAWLAWMGAYATEHGATPEDVLAFHRAFPRLAVPGVAFAVMRLTLPGTEAVGRVAWFAEQSITTYNVGCNAVLLPAAPDAPEAEVVRLQDPRLNYAVREGVLGVWELRRWQKQAEGMGDMDGLVQRALTVARETGLASL